MGSGHIACTFPCALSLYAMPTNLYGPDDKYDLNPSHLRPALLRKAITARKENPPGMIDWCSNL